MSKVIVLGAGPTGLMAAKQLAGRGIEVTVLEAADQVGGMAGSFEVGGQRVDFGSHRLHPATPAPLLAMIGELLGDDLQIRPRAGRLHLADRWVGFPLRAGELARTLPATLTARLVADSALSAARSTARSMRPAAGTAPRAESFADEVTARLGPTVTERFYGPFARKLYGVEPELLDRELAERRVSAGSPGDIAKRLVRASRPAGRTFLYPRLGYGQIVDALADAATDLGAIIHLGESAIAVRSTDDGVTVDGADRSVDGDLVLASIPLPALASLLDPQPDTALTAAMSTLATRAMLLVYLVLDRPQYTEFDAHYLPGPLTRIARLSEPKNYRHGPDPDDRTVLCAEIPCWPDDELLQTSTDDLAAMVATDLERVGLPALAPIGVETRYLPSVYPVFDRAGRSARAQVAEWSRGLGRVVPLGRQGLRVIDNIHHVMAMAEHAAAAVGPGGVFDQDLWTAGLDEFAAHTVED